MSANNDYIQNNKNEISVDIDLSAIRKSWKKFYKNGYNYKFFKPYYMRNIRYDYEKHGYVTEYIKVVGKVTALTAVHFWIYSALFQKDELREKMFPRGSNILRKIKQEIRVILYSGDIHARNQVVRLSNFDNTDIAFKNTFECFGESFNKDVLYFLYYKYLEN